MPLEELKEKAIDVASHVEDMAETYSKLAMINITQKASNIVSAALAMIVVCIFGLLVLFFGGIALCWWLGDMLENRAGGFLLGAAIFAVLMTVIVAIRRKVVFPFIRDLIIKKMYDKDIPARK